jgi:hypothetical protein
VRECHFEVLANLVFYILVSLDFGYVVLVFICRASNFVHRFWMKISTMLRGYEKSILFSILTEALIPVPRAELDVG